MEIIDTNHIQIARCGVRMDPQYRAIYGVLKQLLRSRVLDQKGDRVGGILAAVPCEEIQRAAPAYNVSYQFLDPFVDFLSRIFDAYH